MNSMKRQKYRTLKDDAVKVLLSIVVVQEATVRTVHGTTDWFQIGKGVHQGCIV